MADESLGGAAAGGESTSPSGAAASVPSENPRAAKIANFRATVASALGGAEPPPAGPAADPAKPAPPVAAKPSDPTGEKKPDDPKPDDEAANADPATKRSLDLIEKRDKRAREQLAADRKAAAAELAAAKAELEREKAELAKQARPDLMKLPPAQRALEALKAVGIDPDDEDVMDLVARQTYARSKSGKADPKNKAYADQVAEKDGLARELEELREQQRQLREELAGRDQRATVAAFQQKYLDEAVKAVPADPSFIGLALAANPTKARTALLQLGQQMEREAMEADGAERPDPSHTPTHAQVIARYEADKRQQLEDDGFTPEQIAAMLAKKPAAPAAKPAPPKTLDPTARPGTPTNPGPLSRDEKIAKARVGLQQLRAEAGT